VSFAAISAAVADIEQVAQEVRQRMDEIDRDVDPVVASLPATDSSRVRAARRRRDAAIADLFNVLEQLGTALGAARDAGLPSAYVRPGWS
jgi:6 kDa early secretory antigenic target